MMKGIDMAAGRVEQAGEWGSYFFGLGTLALSETSQLATSIAWLDLHYGAVGAACAVGAFVMKATTLCWRCWRRMRKGKS